MKKIKFPLFLLIFTCICFCVGIFAGRYESFNGTITEHLIDAKDKSIVFFYDILNSQGEFLILSCVIMFFYGTNLIQDYARKRIFLEKDYAESNVYLMNRFFIFIVLLPIFLSLITDKDLMKFKAINWIFGIDFLKDYTLRLPWKPFVASFVVIFECLFIFLSTFIFRKDFLVEKSFNIILRYLMVDFVLSFSIAAFLSFFSLLFYLLEKGKLNDPYFYFIALFIFLSFFFGKVFDKNE